MCVKVPRWFIMGGFKDLQFRSRFISAMNATITPLHWENTFQYYINPPTEYI